MEQNDIDYLSNNVAEVYAQLSTMKYIPLDRTLTKLNKYGEKIPFFDSANSFTVYGLLSLDINVDFELSRNAPRTESNNRIDGSIDLVLKQVKDRGLRIINGDAIDVVNEYGDVDRYTIIGIDKKVELPMVVTKLKVVRTTNLVGD